MWKLLFLIVAAYAAWKLFSNDFLKKRKEEEKLAKKEEERKVAAGEMVKDPECGVYVSIDDSISVRDGGKTYYFCSYDCRDKFLKSLKEGGRVLPGGDD